MEEALEILKKEAEKLKYTLSLFDDIESPENDLKIAQGYNDLIQLRKAIAELEEAMKPKTCEGCRHWGNSQYDWKTERVCNKQVCGPMCKENFTDNIFGCILHEPKANA